MNCSSPKRPSPKTAAQVSLRFLVQEGAIVIPRTSRVERLTENMDIFDFALSAAEMDEIRKLAHRGGRVVTWSGAGQTGTIRLDGLSRSVKISVGEAQVLVQ